MKNKKQRTILFWSENNETILDYCEKLKKIGYKTVSVTSLGKAVDTADEKNAIDFILIDADLVIGDYSLSALKEKFSLQKIPVMFLISHSENMEKIEGLWGTSCFGYIDKNSHELMVKSSIEIAFNLFNTNQKMKKQEESLLQAEKISGFGFWELDLTTKTVVISEGTKLVYGLEKNVLSIDEVRKLPLPEYRKMLDLGILDLIKSGDKNNTEFKLKRYDDGKIIDIYSVAKYDPEKKIVTGTIYDVTEQKKMKELSREKDEYYKGIFENHHAVMLIVDPDNCDILHANPAASEYYGWSCKELMNMKITQINSMNPEKVSEKMKLIKKSGQRKHLFSKNKLADGSVRDVEIHSGPIRLKNKEVICSIVHDFTERKIAQDEIERLAYFDPLTNLPNRKMFSESLEEAIFSAKKNGLCFALLYIDLDNFKNINDSFGHSTGDALLVKISEKLKENLRGNDKIFRLGGDEFAVIVEGISHSLESSFAAERIADLLNESFTFGGHEMYTSGSIGVAVYPHNGEEVETLMKNSDTAMYQAKRDGKNSHKFFKEDMNKKIKKKMTMETKLYSALKDGEFILYYQPRIDFKKREMIGMEALIRWFHNKSEFISPVDFIPLAEESNLILDIDRWVLEGACNQLKIWQEAGLEGQKMSVNISAAHFRQGRILKTLKEVLKKVAIDPTYLELEITEGLFVGDLENVIWTLKKLKSMGISISIDDFGKGYSSLSYIKSLPIDNIKIDRSFISGVTINPEDAAITKTIITMAKSLKLRVVAEGVETQEQVSFLQTEGCHEMQGYYFSRPLSVQDFEKFFKNFTFND